MNAEGGRTTNIPRTSTDKSTLAQKAYEQLRNLIVLGELPQRERLSEVKLAERLDISRTPIREAIRMLEQDGLVSRDSMGAFVTVLSKKEAEDLYRVRIELEGLAVRLAVENKNQEGLDKLRKIMTEIESLQTDSSNIPRVIAVNGNFHSQIGIMSNNFYLKYTLEDIRTRLSLLRANSLMATSRSSESLHEHLDICQAILEGRNDYAIQKAVEHSKAAADFAISRLFI